jgi:hypothetical protein
MEMNNNMLRMGEAVACSKKQWKEIDLEQMHK